MTTFIEAQSAVNQPPAEYVEIDSRISIIIVSSNQFLEYIAQMSLKKHYFAFQTSGHHRTYILHTTRTIISFFSANPRLFVSRHTIVEFSVEFVEHFCPKLGIR